MGIPLKQVSATEFKANCLEFMRQIEARELPGLIVTRRGQPVVEIRAPKPVRRTRGWVRSGQLTVMDWDAVDRPLHPGYVTPDP